MSKEVRFRISFDSQHTKHPQTLLESARQHLYQIFLSFWGKWGQKISHLVICEILELFVNTMTADGKYSLGYNDNLEQSIQTQLCKKQKTLSESFASFASFLHLLCFFFWKKWLDKCLQSPVSEHNSTVNMLNGSKQCWNLHGFTFIIISHQSQKNRVEKCLSKWYLKP